MKEIVYISLAIIGGGIFILTMTGIVLGMGYIVGKYFGIYGIAVGAVIISAAFLKAVVEFEKRG
jgi:hypothetical protein